MSREQYLDAYRALCDRAFCGDAVAQRGLALLLSESADLSDYVLGAPFVDDSGQLVLVDAALREDMERVKTSSRRDAHTRLARERGDALERALLIPEAHVPEVWRAVRRRQCATRDLAAALVARASGGAAAPVLGALFVALDTLVTSRQSAPNSPRTVILWLPDAALVEVGDAALVFDTVMFLRASLGCELLDVSHSSGYRGWSIGMQLSDATVRGVLSVLPAPRYTLAPTVQSLGLQRWSQNTEQTRDIEDGGGAIAAAIAHLTHLESLKAASSGAHFPYRSMNAAGARSTGAAAAHGSVAAVGIVTCGHVLRDDADGRLDTDVITMQSHPTWVMRMWWWPYASAVAFILWIRGRGRQTQLGQGKNEVLLPVVRGPLSSGH